MRHDKIPSARQRRFLFEGQEQEEVWKNIPDKIRDRCRILLLQLLAHVIGEEGRERSRHERQD